MNLVYRSTHKIPKSPHLLFYNFSTNYYEFAKLIIQIWINKRKGM
jgi:hypothetical protein